jgi:hypothetical protein
MDVLHFEDLKALSKYVECQLKFLEDGFCPLLMNISHNFQHESVLYLPEHKTNCHLKIKINVQTIFSVLMLNQILSHVTTHHSSEINTVQLPVLWIAM